MTSNLQPYPAYKDAGVPWLGDVPAHWEVRKQRQLVDMLVSNVDKHSFEGETAVRLCNYVDVYKNDRITERLHFMKATATTDEIQRFRLEKGDVVVTKDSESWSDIGVPALVEYAADDLVCGYHLAILRPRTEQISGEYLYRATQSQGIASQYHVSANGITRYGLTHQGIKSVQLPLPPLPEQAAIVRYLTHMDGRINRLIRAKRKLIALLEEQKQAIIHHAVTRGLDPDVALRPSGVEWLGDVPAHWEERPAKYYFREVDERSTTGEEELLSVSHITGVSPRSQKNITMFKALSYVGHKLCEPGDLVINTMWAWMGALGVANQSGIVSPSYAVYRPIEHGSFMPEFIDHLLRIKPYVSEYICSSTGIRSSRLRLYPEKFLAIPIAIPSIDEQMDIVEAINRENKQLNDAISLTGRQITLLREYRTRLIADVVTGKLDVRAAAAALPEAGEDAASDDLNDPDRNDEENDDNELHEEET
jgi:type I restriction enzyme S subunit